MYVKLLYALFLCRPDFFVKDYFVWVRSNRFDATGLGGDGFAALPFQLKFFVFFWD